MIIRVFENRSVTKDAEPYGTQNENRVTTLNFEFPEGYENFNKKIVFITSDGNYWDIINDNTYIIKNNITKYKNISAFVWLTNVETQVDFRTKIFDIDFNKNINPDDYTPSEEQISGFDTMMQELNEAIEEVKQLPSMKYEVVEELPTEDIDTHTIYLILREEPEGNNYYDEYLYINNSWEKIGSTDVDLSDLIDDIENLENRVFSERNVESESNTLILENTEEDMGLEVSEIDGWTEQDSYEGYNLLPITATTTTISGITITINEDKTITLNGTSTSMLGLDLGHCALVSGSYKGNCETNATTNTYYIRLGEGEGESSTWIANATNNTTFTLSEDKNVYARLIIRNEVTLNNVKIYPMIYSGTTTKPYQKYVGGTASPNPSYPQDINVVTGTQEVVVENANFFKPQLKVDNTDILQIRCAVTLQDDEFTFVASGNDMYFGNVGTSGTSYGNNRGTLIKLPNNASKVYVTTTNTDFNANYICWYDENKTTLGFVLSNSAGNSIPSGAKYMNVRIGKTDSVSGTTYKTKVMVRIDDNTTSYIEHQEQTKTLHLGDIELSKIGTYQDRIYKNNDKWYIEKNNIEKDKDYLIAQVGQVDTITDYARIRVYLNNACISTPTGLCSHLKFEASYSGQSNHFYAQGNYAYLIVDKTLLSTIDVTGAKAYLNTLIGLKILYPLSTPTTTKIIDTTLINDLNALQHLKQYDDTTIITIDDIREYQVTLESDRIVVIENEQVEQNDRIAELEEENSYLSSIVDQIIPKETAEGSSITLDNTLQGKLKLNERKGDTKQDSTNGYQLIDLTLAKLKTYNTSGTWNNNVYTISGLTITINDDMSIKVNGTTTAQVGLLLAGGAIPYPTGTYYLSGASNGSNDTYDVRIFNYDGTSAVAQCFTGTKQVAIVNNSQSFNMALIVRNGVTCNNVMFYPMLSTTNTSDYEPYTNGASPNPTYPQDINVVTGTQEVVVSNSSAYNKGFKDLPNTYQAVKYIQSDGNQYFYLNLQWKNTSKIEAIIGTDNEYNNNVIFSESSSASVWLGFSNSTTMSGGGFTNLTITPQATTTSYKTLDTITFSYSLTSTGNIRWGTYATITYNKTNRIASLKLYDTNNTLIRNMVACYRKSDNVIGMYDLVNNVFYTNEGTGTFTKGDDLQEQTKTLHLGDIELAKIGTYQDRIYKNNDKWYIEKNIGHKKASEITDNNIGLVSQGTSFYNTGVKSDRTLQVYSNVQTWKNTTDTEWNTLNGNYIGILYNVSQIYINKTASVRSEILTWLNSINFEMYYVLSTPTYTEITNETLLNELNELEKMYSYSGQTNISVSGNLPMILDVTALKNLS